MHVICQQESLALVLQAMSKLAQTKAAKCGALLTASRQSRSPGGILTLLGIGMEGAAGMMKQVQAVVEQEGKVLVPIAPLAEYVSTLRPGELTLHRQTAWRRRGASAPEGPVLLRIESARKSASGTLTTNRAIYKAVENDQPMPSVSGWLSTSSRIASVPAQLFREAIAVCAKLSTRRNVAPEMRGVLVHIEAGHMRLVSTTGLLLASYQLSLVGEAACSFTGLFEGHALSWIGNLLPREGMLDLSLAKDEQGEVLLLVMPQMTLFCRAMPAPLPTTWEPTLQTPHQVELEIGRRDLVRALKFFAAASLKGQQALSVEGATLIMQHRVKDDAPISGEWTLPLLHSAPHFHCLLHPGWLKRLVGETTGERVALHFGSFERFRDEERETVSFARLATARTTLMMSISDLHQLTADLPDVSSAQDTAPGHEQMDAVPSL